MECASQEEIDRHDEGAELVREWRDQKYAIRKLSSELSIIQAENDKLRLAIADLLNAKGRHNSGVAYEKLMRIFSREDH